MIARVLNAVLVSTLGVACTSGSNKSLSTDWVLYSDSAAVHTAFPSGIEIAGFLPVTPRAPLWLRTTISSSGESYGFLRGTRWEGTGFQLYEFVVVHRLQSGAVVVDFRGPLRALSQPGPEADQKDAYEFEARLCEIEGRGFFYDHEQQPAGQKVAMEAESVSIPPSGFYQFSGSDGGIRLVQAPRAGEMAKCVALE